MIKQYKRVFCLIGCCWIAASLNGCKDQEQSKKDVGKLVDIALNNEHTLFSKPISQIKTTKGQWFVVGTPSSLMGADVSILSSGTSEELCLSNRCYIVLN
jgi:hypothetical protein